MAAFAKSASLPEGHEAAPTTALSPLIPPPGSEEEQLQLSVLNWAFSEENFDGASVLLAMDGLDSPVSGQKHTLEDQSVPPGEHSNDKDSATSVIFPFGQSGFSVTPVTALDFATFASALLPDPGGISTALFTSPATTDTPTLANSACMSEVGTIAAGVQGVVPTSSVPAIEEDVSMAVGNQASGVVGDQVSVTPTSVALLSGDTPPVHETLGSAATGMVVEGDMGVDGVAVVQGSATAAVPKTAPDGDLEMDDTMPLLFTRDSFDEGFTDSEIEMDGSVALDDSLDLWPIQSEDVGMATATEGLNSPAPDQKPGLNQPTYPGGTSTRVDAATSPLFSRPFPQPDFGAAPAAGLHSAIYNGAFSPEHSPVNVTLGSTATEVVVEGDMDVDGVAGVQGSATAAVAKAAPDRDLETSDMMPLPGTRDFSKEKTTKAGNSVDLCDCVSLWAEEFDYVDGETDSIVDLSDCVVLLWGEGCDDVDAEADGSVDLSDCLALWVEECCEIGVATAATEGSDCPVSDQEPALDQSAPSGRASTHVDSAIPPFSPPSPQPDFLAAWVAGSDTLTTDVFPDPDQTQAERWKERRNAAAAMAAAATPTRPESSDSWSEVDAIAQGVSLCRIGEEGDDVHRMEHAATQEYITDALIATERARRSGILDNALAAAMFLADLSDKPIESASWNLRDIRHCVAHDRIAEIVAEQTKDPMPAKHVPAAERVDNALAGWVSGLSLEEAGDEQDEERFIPLVTARASLQEAMSSLARETEAQEKEKHARAVDARAHLVLYRKKRSRHFRDRALAKCKGKRTVLTLESDCARKLWRARESTSQRFSASLQQAESTEEVKRLSLEEREKQRAQEEEEKQKEEKRREEASARACLLEVKRRRAHRIRFTALEKIRNERVEASLWAVSARRKWREREMSTQRRKRMVQKWAS